jgi:hypothetical protein
VNLRLIIARVYLPDSAKKERLRELFRVTAEAFQQRIPETTEAAFGDCLQSYSNFTKTQTEAYIQDGQDIEGLKRRLFQGAEKLGEKIRRSYNITTFSEVIRMSRILYKALGIDFRCDLQGQVIIRRCFFSRCYSAEVCRIISLLDQGILAGLSDGGELKFSHRITEGNACCKAHLVLPEEIT